MAHNYVLQVTAGSEYDITKHQIVPVNIATPIRIENEHIDVSLNVRIQAYRGLPLSSPSTSPYFNLPRHSKDQYAISFSFKPKSNINGDDLVFGNDFDHPIRDRLPPGFNTAFRIVKWVVDPGIDGDVMADKPYLYGPTGSSVNILHIGKKVDEGEEVEYDEKTGLVFDEGGHEEGIKVRRSKGVPDTESGRRKWFLSEERRRGWEWEEGRRYGCEFYNPYIDFNDFALRLPGFTLPIMKYWDGQGARKVVKRSHTLRYVLLNRKTNTVLLVVLFTLYLKEDIDEQGKVKEGAEGGVPFDCMTEEKREKHNAMRNGTAVSNGVVKKWQTSEETEVKEIEDDGMKENIDLKDLNLDEEAVAHGHTTDGGAYKGFEGGETSADDVD